MRTPAAPRIREEEIKNRVAREYFSRFDTTRILGNVDFCVAAGRPGAPEIESLLWAEAKAGTRHDIHESLVQLILTIGRARTFDSFLPPLFLGAFDAEKIALITWRSVADVFVRSDFNWNVTPSDHSTREFRLLHDIVREDIRRNLLLFVLGRDDDALRDFIRAAFVPGSADAGRIAVTRNNFAAVYQRWRTEVMPSIRISWDRAREKGILDADFYLADLLSADNVTLKDRLFVILNRDRYEFDRTIDEMDIFSTRSAQFRDGQEAHRRFWSIYERPPREEFWDYIMERRDLLVPQDVRERKGSYFTPARWVELSQRCLADVLGDDWQDRHLVWDCAAGTGNLLSGLTNRYNVWASTLDQADVDVMHDRIRNGAALLDAHVFQFDFLNDSFDRLPAGLKAVIDDPAERERLVVYINPPYAEAANRRTISGTGRNRDGVAVGTRAYAAQLEHVGIAARELFVQFLTRIFTELPGVRIACFSKLKILQSPNFRRFRELFRARLERCLIVPANTFDNVRGSFPIGFQIWDTRKPEIFSSCTAEVYDAQGRPLPPKRLVSCDGRPSINDWLIATRDRLPARKIGFLSCYGCDFQHQNNIFIINDRSQLPHPRGSDVTDRNLAEAAVCFAVRKCIPADWLNDRDQFMHPDPTWRDDAAFRTDCLIWTIFHTDIRSGMGTNHWIPFTEQEVGARARFTSRFMADRLAGRHAGASGGAAAGLVPGAAAAAEDIPPEFSPEARDVLDAGRELWRHYHAQEDSDPNAAFHDIREWFQGRDGSGRMRSGSHDARYTELLAALRARLSALSDRIVPKIYEHGFLPR